MTNNEIEIKKLKQKNEELHKMILILKDVQLGTLTTLQETLKQIGLLKETLNDK